MAKSKHLEILMRGVGAWNKWRNEHSNALPDLHFADLTNTNLSNANFSNTDLGLADLSGADLSKVQLSGADLSNAKFVRVNFSGADFRGANLYNAKLSDSNFDRAKFSGANLSYANFSDAYLNKADFGSLNLSHAILYRVKLYEANLDSANLYSADLRRADLTNADLSNANLGGANLEYANLIRADLKGADLNSAKLLGATFDGVNLRHADFTGTSFYHTIFAALDLSQVKGLETAEHSGPSTIGIDTIYKSRGKIPEAFLRGCGLPEPFIVNIPALVAALEPIQFYSCFISYSSKDRPFTERLHADLQQKGVRCWFAPEDLRIGDKFRDRIDESIRIHDKLLIVLSEHSVGSPWVNDEVEAAMERENREGRTVLFPIKIDEAVTESEQAWTAKIRRTRHIGDFMRWKEHDSYTKAFDRLIRDLKAEAT
jgi:uncharacterized protein YjbI with pentapeptide repeats